MKTNKEFLQNNPLELALLEEESKEFRKIIKESQENYVLDVEEKQGVKTDIGSYTDFYVICPTRGFANAYFHLGQLFNERVVPIWKRRFNTQKTVKKFVREKKK